MLMVVCGLYYVNDLSIIINFNIINYFIFKGKAMQFHWLDDIIITSLQFAHTYKMTPPQYKTTNLICCMLASN